VITGRVLCEKKCCASQDIKFVTFQHLYWNLLKENTCFQIKQLTLQQNDKKWKNKLLLAVSMAYVENPPLFTR
jgi:hypothetical protein